MRPLSVLLILSVCAATTPCAAQALSPAAEIEVRRLEGAANLLRRQALNPALCTQLKQRAMQWREQATKSASPVRENLLASADKEEAGAERCLKTATEADANLKYYLAQADRIKKREPLALPERSQAVTEKYSRARKALQELIDFMRSSAQRMVAQSPRLHALVGKRIAFSAARGNPSVGPGSDNSGVISQTRGERAESDVNGQLKQAEDRLEKMYYLFADKFNPDSWLEDPRNYAFNFDDLYTQASGMIDGEWLLAGNEVAWHLKMMQFEANEWAGQQYASAQAEAEAFEAERGAVLSAAQNNPGTLPLLKFEADTQSGIEAYCGRYETAMASHVVALASAVQGLANQLTERRNFLMQIRNRLVTDLLPYAVDRDRGARTALNYPMNAGPAGYDFWPAGLALDVAVKGYMHPGAYHYGRRIGFIACADWREQMPTNISARFPAVTARFDDTASLNLNLINPLVLEGEAEGRAPEQQL